VDYFKLGQALDLETFVVDSGSLTICEPSKIDGFAIKRVYFLHSLKEESERGSHAHRALHQLVIAASGSFTLALTRFGDQKIIEANSPNFAYYIPPLTWREIANFSPDAVCLVLASEVYAESDYIRDRKVFDEMSRYS